MVEEQKFMNFMESPFSYVDIANNVSEFSKLQNFLLQANAALSGVQQAVDLMNTSCNAFGNYLKKNKRSCEDLWGPQTSVAISTLSEIFCEIGSSNEILKLTLGTMFSEIATQFAKDLSSYQNLAKKHVTAANIRNVSIRNLLDNNETPSELAQKYKASEMLSFDLHTKAFDLHQRASVDLIQMTAATGIALRSHYHHCHESALTSNRLSDLYSSILAATDSDDAERRKQQQQVRGDGDDGLDGIFDVLTLKCIVENSFDDIGNTDENDNDDGTATNAASAGGVGDSTAVSVGKQVLSKASNLLFNNSKKKKKMKTITMTAVTSTSTPVFSGDDALKAIHAISSSSSSLLPSSSLSLLTSCVTQALKLSSSSSVQQKQHHHCCLDGAIKHGYLWRMVDRNSSSTRGNVMSLIESSSSSSFRRQFVVLNRIHLIVLHVDVGDDDDDLFLSDDYDRDVDVDAMTCDCCHKLKRENICSLKLSGIREYQNLSSAQALSNSSSSSSVAPVAPYSFEIICSNQTQILFQCEGSDEYFDWIHVIKMAMEDSIVALPAVINSNNKSTTTADDDNVVVTADDDDETSSRAIISKSLSFKKPASSSISFLDTDDLIKDLLHANPTCADCSSKSAQPTWISLNLGVVVCIKCSGVHRSLGSHISRIRSLVLDVIDPEELALTLYCLQGNEKLNQTWEANVASGWRKPCADDDTAAIMDDADVRDKWIRAKYQWKGFLGNLESTEDFGSEVSVRVHSERLAIACLHRDTWGAYLSLVHGANPSFRESNIELIHPSNRNSDIFEIVRSNWSPLHAACVSGSVMCVALLFVWGSDLNVVDSGGRRGVDVAREFNHVGFVVDVMMALVCDCGVLGTENAIINIITTTTIAC